MLQNKIFTIRGKQVMIDPDLAVLYGVETKVLNQAVKRNLDRFPDDFMFSLTKKEQEFLRSQFVTLNDAKDLKPQVINASNKIGSHTNMEQRQLKLESDTYKRFGFGMSLGVDDGKK